MRDSAWYARTRVFRGHASFAGKSAWPLSAKSAPVCLGLGLLGLFALCGCRTGAPNARVESASDVVPAEAMAAYGRGLQQDYASDPKGALAWYLKAISADPARSPAYLRALAAHGELRRKGVESDLPDALQALADRLPHEVEPLRWIARVHAADDRKEEAITAYTNALHQAPSDPRLHGERLMQYLRANRFSDLPAAFRNAFRQEVDPAVLVAPAGEWLLRTQQNEAPGDAEDVLALLEQIQARSTNRPQVLLLLGQIYHHAKEPARATGAFRQAQRAAPDLPEVYVRQAILRLEENDYEGARKVLAEGADRVDPPLDLLRLLVEITTQHALLLDAGEAPEAAAAAREEAIAAVRRLLESLPREARLWLRLGDLLILSGRMEDAVRELGNAPHPDADLQRDIARRLLAAGAPNEAVTLLRTMADEHPRDAGIHLMLGEILAQIGQPEEALKILEKAGRMPTPPPAVFLRQALLLTDGDHPEQAFEAIEQGMARLGEEPALRELGALLLIELGRPEEALAWHQKLPTPDDDALSLSRRLHRALALQYVGDPDEAAFILAEELENERTAIEEFVYLSARLDDRFGDRTATRNTLRRLREKRPDDPTAWLAVGVYNFIAREYADAVVGFETAHAKARGHPQEDTLLTAHFFFLYGAVSERVGDEDRAMRFLAKAIRLDPDHANALNNLAYLWAERAMNLDQAKAYVTRALELEPESAAYIDTLGWIYYRQGRYEEALVELKRAQAIEPDDPTISDHVGEALLKLDRIDEAIEQWRHALGLDPEDPEAIRAKLREHGEELPADPEPDE